MLKLLSKSLLVLSVVGTIVGAKTVKMNLDDDQTIQQVESGQPVKLKVGDLLEITVSSNPTTGFDWEYSPNEESNDSRIKIISNEYEQEDVDTGDMPPMSGVGGKNIITIKVQKKGKYDFQMGYAQPWTVSGFGEDDIANYAPYYDIKLQVN